MLRCDVAVELFDRAVLRIWQYDSKHTSCSYSFLDARVPKIFALQNDKHISCLSTEIATFCQSVV